MLSNTAPLSTSVLSYKNEKGQANNQYYSPPARLPGTDKQYDGCEQFYIATIM